MWFLFFFPFSLSFPLDMQNHVHGDPYSFAGTLKSVLVTQSCQTATPRTGARQAPLSTDFSRQAYLSGELSTSPGTLKVLVFLRQHFRKNKFPAVLFLFFGFSDIFPLTAASPNLFYPMIFLTIFKNLHIYILNKVNKNSQISIRSSWDIRSEFLKNNDAHICKLEQCPFIPNHDLKYFSSPESLS